MSVTKKDAQRNAKGGTVARIRRRARFPVFFPVRPSNIADEWTWAPYNVWWLIILMATYFTVFFVPFDVAFSRETTGPYHFHALFVSRLSPTADVFTR